jgi:hypothetical protein
VTTLDPPVPAYTVNNGYISFPILTDPDSLMAAQLDFIAQQLPGFVPRDGHLEVLLLQTFAQMCAQTAQVAAQVPLAIFNYLGTKLLNLPVQTGAAATAPSTWVMVDTAGYTIPAGTVVGYAPTGDQLILFTVQAAVTVAPGASSTPAGGVTLVAQTVGVAGNGLAAGPVTIVDSLAFVSSITSTAISAGGVDPETQTAYLSRLSSQLQLLTPRPILPGDFAALAPRTLGVGRALAIDGLSPGRVVTDGVSTSASTTVTSATAAFTTDDVGRAVTGTATMTVTDGVTTASSTTVTSATAAFTSADVGVAISGGSIPVGTTILTFTNSTTVVLSAAPTATATGVTFTFTARPVLPAGATIASRTSGTAVVLSAGATRTATAVTLTFGKLTGQARALTLGVVDAAGAACTTGVKNTLKASLAAQREVNFLISIIDPTFTAIAVTYTVVITAGASAATVQAAVNAALSSYLSPATFAGGTQTPPVWNAGVTTIRYLDLASLIHGVTGVDHINSLTFGIQGGALATSDVTLIGDAPLPQTGTLTPTILTS